MAHVVGVVFHNGSKTYHFDPAGLELSKGDRVVVQTMKGTEIGQVVEPPHVVDDAELPAPLKKVLRVATGEDLRAQADSAAVRKDAMAKCRELIEAHGLDMKLVDAEVSFGGEKITFSFYADDRVDFRALVADLARTLQMRVELRQIGAREEARMIGGLGPCGRHLCCSLFPGNDEPVSIRMAKEQNLPLNPMKISGLCGRLMCCLKYEQEQYVSFRKEAPAKGTPVQLGELRGNVVGYNVLKEAVVVRLEDGTVSDVRLCTCERDEDGCLHCTREVEEPKRALADVGYLMPSIGLTRSLDLIEEAADEDAGGSSQGGLSTAEPTRATGDQVGEGESEAKGETKSRSRRGRARRRRSRGAGGENGATGTERPADNPVRTGAATPEGEGGAKQGGSRVRKSRRRKPVSGRDSGQPRPQVGKESRAESGAADAGEETAKRPRRRRRPRRRPGPGDGGNGIGDAGEE